MLLRSLHEPETVATARGSSVDVAPQDGRADANRDVLTGFLGLIVRLSGARAGAVRKLNATGDSLELVASVGMPTGLRSDDQSRPANCGICGSALKTADLQRTTSEVSCSVSSDSRAPGGVGGHALAVPLQDQERSIGVLNLFFRSADRVPDDAVEMLRPFGPVLGLALENERLARENLAARLANEREAMAADIHDALAQSLTFARMRMSLLRDAMRANDTAKGERYCTDIDDELRGAQARLRDMIRHFRAGMDARGLLPSLRELAAEFSVRRDIALRFDCRAKALDLTAEQELQVFHIVGEALANVGKHSGARNARLSIERGNGEVRVTVEDDGRGVALGDLAAGPRADDGTHHGLRIMRERAARAGGRLSVDRINGGGVRVELTLPCTQAASRAAGSI
jgi:two-component system nitrate/nitrite sensor histidine kinase NarX